MTKEDLIPRLKNERVSELVIVSMLGLPDQMPTNFQETYTPIAAAGGMAQVTHLARLISAQMTNAGIGVGAEKMQQLKKVFPSISSLKDNVICNRCFLFFFRLEMPRKFSHQWRSYQVTDTKHQVVYLLLVALRRVPWQARA